MGSYTNEFVLRLQVDGVTLDGCNNQKAVELLRGTGQTIHLKLARHKAGSKYQQWILATSLCK